MLDKIKAIYNSLPLKHLKFLKWIPNVFLFGRSYKNNYQSVTYEPSVVDMNLYNVLNYARESTVFWKSIIPKKFSVSEAKDVLKELPIIGPNDLSRDVKYFLSRDANESNSYRTTTGGTGRNPTTIILANKSFSIEWAHIYRIWDLINYNRFKNLKLTLRGKTLKEGRLWAFNPIYNEIIVDTFKLNSSNFLEFYNGIRSKKIDYIHSYPSLLKELIEYLDEYGVFLKIRGIMLGSEGARPSEKRFFMNYFKCPVVHWYGQTEKVVLAYDQECGDSFTVFTSYGYPCIKNSVDGYGEILGTTFVNKALPLINYRTGDFGRISYDDFIKIYDLKGRWGKDFIYLDNNKKIPTTSINLHSNVQELILFYQIVQDVYGEILIKIVPKNSVPVSNDTLINMFKDQLQDKLRGFNVKYQITENKSILRSDRGKRIFLVQNIGKN